VRILQIVPHYIPSTRFGGPQRVAHFLGKALLRLGHEVTVCTTNLKDEVTDLNFPIDVPVDVDGVRVYYESTRLFRYWGFSPALMRRVKKELRDTDLVLVHAHYQFANLVGAWLARRAQKPYVIFTHASLHQQGISHKNGFLKRCYLRLLEHGNLSNAAFLAFNAPEEKASSLYGNCGKVIPNGISPIEFADMPPADSFRDRYPHLKGKLCLLFLGRLDIQQKGLDMLIPAFARLCKSISHVHLVLAGPDEDDGAHRVQELARQHGVEDSITLTGLIEGKDKLAALQEADVFVLPSRFEGLSIALLEAMYMGLPVIVTNRVGLWREIAEKDCGYVVSREENELTEALLRIAKNRERARMGMNGKALVAEKYTWDVIARNLMEEIQEAV
jgi:glycosyltransferase involved in cell wall biosynthesis